MNALFEMPEERSVRTVDRELTIKDVWSLLSRRRSIVFGVTIALVALAVLFCIVSTRYYKAVGQVQVQKDSSDALGLESMMGAAEGASDALDANITIQTQASILQSDTLALDVINQLHLEGTPDFRKKFNPISWALGLISPSGAKDVPGATLEDSPVRRVHALKVFSKRLTVKPVSGTRLLEIDYLNPDPKIAASVVNALIASLTDYTFQTRYIATKQASTWLSGQLTDLRDQSEKLQAKVVQLEKDSGVFTMGGTDAEGREQVYAPVVDRLQQATAAVSQAEASRIMKGAIYQVTKTGDAELISGLSGNTALVGSAPAISNSLALIQNLRGQEATIQGGIEQLSAKFGPEYPKVQELKGNLAGIQESIHAEVQRVAARAQNDYIIAEQAERGARNIFNQQKTEANAMNNKAIDYVIARQEAEQSRLLYEDLLKHLNEAGVIAGLQSSNITVVDKGLAPDKPVRPNVPIYLAVAFAGGLFLGCCSAFFVDLMDSKIHDIRSLEEQIGAPLLGILPSFKDNRGKLGTGGAGSNALTSAKSRLIALSEPQSPFTEALRALRTSLMLSRGGSPPKVILVTSSVASEGKSTLSSNLAVLLAQQGSRILLVDADLRRPMLHRRLGISSAVGLSSLLTGYLDESKGSAAVVPLPDVPSLEVLPAGPIPPYPAELLGSEQMRVALAKWRHEYDFVILDGAPALPVTDSVILSGMVDAVLLVARFQATERQSLERSYRTLGSQSGSEKKVAIVLNAVERSATSYYEYYGYQDSSYYETNKETSA